MYKKETGKQIIVIGNGFDLACKLKTSYNDFFLKRYNNKIKEYFENRYFNNISKEHIENYGLVDYILLAKCETLNGEILWSNVESEIALMTMDDSPYNLKSLAEHYINIFVKKDKGSKLKMNDSETGIFLNKSRIIECLITNKVLPSPNEVLFMREIIKEKIVSDIEIHFENSIFKFENAFKKYLEECVIDNTSYLNNARKLFDSILQVGYSEDYSQSYLINFNYTAPFQNKFYESNNIHGNYNDNFGIIFGIDEGDVPIGSLFYKYTKTYRKIMLDSAAKKEVSALPTDITKINFFGHSLSEADYSYFQSIFDYYNIYNSSVILNFYYVSYCDNILNTTVSQVSKLLKRYGETLDNINHGKNLLHKLNLEGRLQIRTLGITYLCEGQIIKEVIN